jgi:hypothetical protein
MLPFSLEDREIVARRFLDGQLWRKLGMDRRVKPGGDEEVGTLDQ